MSQQPATSADSLSRLRRIDALCLRFEDDWKAGRRPSIEDYLAPLPAGEQEGALVELLVVEWSSRSRIGESYTFEEYARRFAAQGAACAKAERLWKETWQAATEKAEPPSARFFAPPAPGGADAVAENVLEREAGAALCTPDEARTTPDAPRAPGEPAPWPVAIGPYRLLEQLGRGGMGVVYKAQHDRLRHFVALKVVKAGIHATPQDRERFRREGEALARLQHPNVVRIHHFDEYEGQPYFVMDLLEGGSLAGRLAGRPQLERTAARLVEDIARGVHAAHRLGIVHRDLKPANVLLAGPPDLPIEECVPEITDFGLAKLVDADGSQTMTGAILGTPSYMAPEMAHGDGRAVGPAADVYALGAILYECLTGRPPFKGGSHAETLEQVRTRRPDDPSRLRPGLSRGLEAACLKCLAKEPAQRYASAEALADDLRCWLNGLPMKVRPPGLLGRVGGALARRPRRVGAVALGVLLAVAAWLAWALADPDRPIKRIEAALARGEAQGLIGETGRPAWSRCSVGDKAAKVEVGRDGTLFVNTWSLTLLELVRDPQGPSYRLSAEVRHDAVRAPGEVGIYVGHRQFEGEAHSYLLLSFNDIGGQNVYVGPHLYRVAGRSPEPEYSLGWPATPLQPPGLGSTDWRQVAVEVRPGDVRAFWEGNQIGAWTTDQLAEAIQDAQQKERQNPVVDPVASLPPDFAPRGALGLYVKVGSASFRRVVIRPLNETE
jgi:serine/threonine-protein kinase